jgi:hypothetical protein
MHKKERKSRFFFLSKKRRRKRMESPQGEEDPLLKRINVNPASEMENVFKVVLLDLSVFRSLPMEWLLLETVSLVWFLSDLYINIKKDVFVSFLVAQSFVTLFGVAVCAMAVLSIRNFMWRKSLPGLHWTSREAASWCLESSFAVAACFLIPGGVRHLAVRIRILFVVGRGFLVFMRCKRMKLAYLRYAQEAVSAGQDSKASDDYVQGFMVFFELASNFTKIAQRKNARPMNDRDFVFGVLDAAKIFLEPFQIDYMSNYVRHLSKALSASDGHSLHTTCSLWIADRGCGMAMANDFIYSNPIEMVRLAVEGGHRTTLTKILMGRIVNEKYEDVIASAQRALKYPSDTARPLAEIDKKSIECIIDAFYQKGP